jgi:tetratricopeptide (TPR) repeat protein
MVATAWHQIGIVHEEACQFEAAEQAYRQSLALEVQENNFVGQASSLAQLGHLYHRIGRLEDAVTFYRQAADVHIRLKDQHMEGRDRGNLAVVLIQLERYNEARQELQRAIECLTPYGHAAQRWKAWGRLQDLERATGHAAAARAAREQAIQTYLAYRRAGGYSQTGRAQLFTLVAQAIQQDAPAQAREPLDQLAAHPDAPPDLKALIAQLQRLLAGDRTPTFAADPDLHYMDGAELQLLLES